MLEPRTCGGYPDLPQRGVGPQIIEVPAGLSGPARVMPEACGQPAGPEGAPYVGIATGMKTEHTQRTHLDDPSTS